MVHDMTDWDTYYQLAIFRICGLATDTFMVSVLSHLFRSWRDKSEEWSWMLDEQIGRTPFQVCVRCCVLNISLRIGSFFRSPITAQTYARSWCLWRGWLLSRKKAITTSRDIQPEVSFSFYSKRFKVLDVNQLWAIFGMSHSKLNCVRMSSSFGV